MAHPFEIDVSTVAPAGATTEAGDLFVPDGEAGGDGGPSGSRPLVVCLPGGGMTRRYFDLPEELPGRWSLARHLVDDHGAVVVALDHLGVGDSPPPDDPYTLTPRVVAAVHAHVVAQVVGRLASGTLVPEVGPIAVGPVIGCGHSMGAMLVVHQQAGHRSFAALALLGFGGAGLPEHLDDTERRYSGRLDELELALPELVAARFGTALVPARPGEGTTASAMLNVGVTTPGATGLLGGAAGALLATAGLTSMIPGTSDAALAAVDVPVFLGVGEHDIVLDADRLARLVPAAASVTEYVVPGAGHNHVIADSRRLLFDELGRWVEAVAAATPSPD